MKYVDELVGCDFIVMMKIRGSVSFLEIRILLVRVLHFVSKERPNMN